MSGSGVSPPVSLPNLNWGSGVSSSSGVPSMGPQQLVTRPVLFIFFLDYWQVTLIWSPYGDASLICSLLIGDTSTTYYTDVAIRVTMTLY